MKGWFNKTNTIAHSNLVPGSRAPRRRTATPERRYFVQLRVVGGREAPIRARSRGLEEPRPGDVERCDECVHVCISRIDAAPALSGHAQVRRRRQICTRSRGRAAAGCSFPGAVAAIIGRGSTPGRVPRMTRIHTRCVWRLAFGVWRLNCIYSSFDYIICLYR